MKNFRASIGVVWLLAAAIGVAHADSYSDTVSVFKRAGESRMYFDHSYAYAIFPTIGQAGLVVGGAHGKGRVYVHGRLVGDATLSQVSAGFQAGGKAFSEVVFFEDERSLAEFQSGSFEFSAGASAIAITASADASAGTTGTSAGASGTQNNATTVGGYTKGMAVFTVAKGGLMYSAAVAGQKFSYSPRGTG